MAKGRRKGSKVSRKSPVTKTTHLSYQNRTVYPTPYPSQNRRPRRPTTWPGILRLRTHFDIKVNEALASLLQAGTNPTKRQICDKLGLDYDNGDDREKVSNALHNLKETFDYAWRQVYVGLGQYDKDYAALTADTAAYGKWKKEEKPELYDLLQQYDLVEGDIREFWVHSKLWERFLIVANEWNMYLVVAYGQPFVADSWTYRQPDFWDYTVKQIQIARNLGKGVISILERHRDLGMMLTSGEKVEVALQTATDTLQLVADGTPMRHRCDLCGEVFESQRELAEHWKQHHMLPP